MKYIQNKRKFILLKEKYNLEINFKIKQQTHRNTFKKL